MSSDADVDTNNTVQVAITAIRSSLPPATDYLTYLTIVESHLEPAILPTLNELLQDATLTQNIGWDLIQLLTPLPGAQTCLNTIARLGNPREVVLKVTEALTLLGVDDDADEADDDVDKIAEDVVDEDLLVPTRTLRFARLLSLLAVLHARIKTRYPSRFLSTSLAAVLSAYRPDHQSTSAVIAFLHAGAGNKRPPLPHRQSSVSVSVTRAPELNAEDAAPDPEAAAEDPHEADIRTKLLQSFVTHVLEVYINANPLDWSARLQEHLDPQRVVVGRRTLKDAYRDEPVLVDREMMVGQLVAVARDLGLSGCEILFDAIYAESGPSGDEVEVEHPSSPDDVPLSRAASLYLVAYQVFSSVIFDANVSLPPISLFPGHAKLLQHFLGTSGPATIGSEPTAVIDSLLSIGLWLEHANRFVSGPLEDDDFLQYLQTLSLLSANTPDSRLRYAAHSLLSLVLHAHPVDRVRLTFIVDTLENCPYDTLRASAVGWLKQELITACQRKSDNLFSSTVALAAAQPYLFPDISALVQASDRLVWQDFRPSLPFHMAVLNFWYLIRAEPYEPVRPSGMRSVVQDIYLTPLRALQTRLLTSLKVGGELYDSMGGDEIDSAAAEIDLLSQRLEMVVPEPEPEPESASETKEESETEAETQSKS